MKIAKYSIEEIFNKDFLWKYSRNVSYIRQLLSLYFNYEPEKAEEIRRCFEDEIIQRIEDQTISVLSENSIVDFNKQAEMMAKNWEFIINEFFMCLSPYHGLTLISNQSVKELFDIIVNWFLNQTGSMSIQLLSEIKELYYEEYHTYNNHIRKMYNKLSNISVDLSNYVMLQPYQSYADAQHITTNSTQWMSIIKLSRLIRNLNIENKILARFDLKMINSFLINSNSGTRNVMLTTILRYAIVSKMTGKTPATLEIPNGDIQKISYNDIIHEIEKLDFAEEIFNYLYDTIKKIEDSGIEIETLI